jgi:hypothetical protein
MSFEAHVGGPVAFKLLDGQLRYFERMSPKILIELGSYNRAMTGGGKGWLSIDQCLDLITTVEGMRWLAWRCAVKAQPEFAGDAGRERFYLLIEDFHLLSSLVSHIAAMPNADPQAGAEGTA